MTTNRRNVLRWMVGGSMAVSLPTSWTLQAETTSAVKGDLWDVHVHLTHAWYGEKHGPLTAEHLLRWMDAHGIARACVLPLVSPEAFWYPISTDDVLQQTKPYRDRLIPFCAIDPRTLETHLSGDRDVVDMLSRYRDAGARGFGEHKPRLAIDDPSSMRLYAACAETCPCCSISTTQPTWILPVSPPSPMSSSHCRISS
jgi:uncharacterized protein